MLSGEFPAGRPRWEDAGAQFVEDIEPYENRGKLWLLNGSHSLLGRQSRPSSAAAETVAEALADPKCAGWVEAFWDEAGEVLLPAHRSRHRRLPALRPAGTRTATPASHTTLPETAIDGSTKLRMRAIPTLRAEREAWRGKGQPVRG